MSVQLMEGDCREILPTLSARSIDCCITSPPYWGLRDYGVESQLGQERTPEEYVQNLVGVFRLVAHKLLDRGTLWLNLGDMYADEQLVHALVRRRTPDGLRPWATGPTSCIKPKDLLGIPWRVAFALQEDGWYLRSDIIWHKPNAKPEPVTDRPTKSHEYVFLLTRRESYAYDADVLREPVTSTGGASFGKQLHDTTGTGAQSRKLRSAAQRNHPLGKNKRTVWTIPTASFHGAHFAVFPPDLVRPCIQAGCPPGGTVVDPFAGSGTTGLVARELGRDAILIELNPVYIEMQRERLGVQDVLRATDDVRASHSDPNPKPAPKRKAGNGPMLWDAL